MSTETKEEIVTLELAVITTLQTRAGLRPDAARELMIAIDQRKSIDPAIVVRDADSNPPRCWMADGHHRLEAYRQLGRPVMPCRVRAGNKWDAIRIGLEANRRHVGERMTRADKEHAVRMVLQERPALADGAIAELVGCDPKTVAKYRSEMEAGQEIPTCDAREGIDGKVYEVASHRRKTAKPSQGPMAAFEDTYPKKDRPSREKPFEPTTANFPGSSSDFEKQKNNPTERSTFPAESSASGETNSHPRMARSDRCLPRNSVNASSSYRDGDGSGRVGTSRPQDFEKAQREAHEHLGRMANRVDIMKSISANPGLYREFRSSVEKLSPLLSSWPPIPDGSSDATAPKSSQATNDDTDDF